MGVQKDILKEVANFFHGESNPQYVTGEQKAALLEEMAKNIVIETTTDESIFSSPRNGSLNKQGQVIRIVLQTPLDFELRGKLDEWDNIEPVAPTTFENWLQSKVLEATCKYEKYPFSPSLKAKLKVSAAWYKWRKMMIDLKKAELVKNYEKAFLPITKPIAPNT